MRQETREQLLNLLSEATTLTTQEIADSISLSRSATSLYLNELLDQNEIQKSGTKPVYWSIAESENKGGKDAFAQYIGSNGKTVTAGVCVSAVLWIVAWWQRNDAAARPAMIAVACFAVCTLIWLSHAFRLAGLVL